MDWLTLEQWRQTHAEPLESGPRALVHGQLYEVDGGVFRAEIEPDTGHWALWTYFGYAGPVVGRTGFEVDADGGLHDRIFDFESEQQLVMVPARLTVTDLEPVTVLEAHGVNSVEALAARFPELWQTLVEEQERSGKEQRNR